MPYLDNKQVGGVVVEEKREVIFNSLESLFSGIESLFSCLESEEEKIFLKNYLFNMKEELLKKGKVFGAYDEVLNKCYSHNILEFWVRKMEGERYGVKLFNYWGSENLELRLNEKHGDNASIGLSDIVVRKREKGESADSLNFEEITTGFVKLSGGSLKEGEVVLKYCDYIFLLRNLTEQNHCFEISVSLANMRDYEPQPAVTDEEKSVLLELGDIIKNKLLN